MSLHNFMIVGCKTGSPFCVERTSTSACFADRRTPWNDRPVVSVTTLTLVVLLCINAKTGADALASDITMPTVASEAGTNRVATADLQTKSKAKSVDAASGPKLSTSKSKDSDDATLTSPGVELAKSRVKELMPLLERLKKRAPHQYEKAIRDLDRSAKRLETIRKRDEKLFDAAMREWTTRSEIQLRKAKLHVAHTGADAEQLEQLQRKLIGIQIERLEREIELNDVKTKAYEERIKALQRQLDASPDGKRSPAATKKPMRGTEKNRPLPSQESL